MSESQSDLAEFVIVPVWLLTAVSPRAVQVYAVMARYADNDTGDCFPKIETIADNSGCSVDAVRRAHRELEDVGALVIYPNRGPGPEGRQPNRYRVQGRTTVTDSNHRGGLRRRVNTPSTSATPPPFTPSKSATPPLAEMPGRTRPTELDKSDSSLRSESRDDEATKLAAHLAARIGNNGSRTPTVTKQWVTDLERMNRIDGRTWDEIRAAIDWSQDHEFWASVILSPRKLRAKYDQMRLQAKRAPAPQESKFVRARQIAETIDREGITLDHLLAGTRNTQTAGGHQEIPAVEGSRGISPPPTIPGPHRPLQGLA